MSLRQLIGVRTALVVVFFAALELGLSLFTSYGSRVVNERDPDLGWRMIPNQLVTDKDGSSDRRINSFGFRDREWDAPRRNRTAEANDPASAEWTKDANVFRVALVGNSMTYGSGVPTEATFGRELERRIAAEFEQRGDTRQVLVMNFAVMGYVFEQMARTYERSIRPFRPDLLVVGTATHDVVPFEGGPQELDFPYRHRIVLTATHDLLLERVMLPVKSRLEPCFENDRAEIAADALDAAITANPFDPEHEPYWNAMRSRMEDVRRLVEADGGRLVIQALPQLSVITRSRSRSVGDVWNEWARELPRRSGRPPVLVVDPRDEFEAAMKNLLVELRDRGYKKSTVEDPLTGSVALDPAFLHRNELLYLSHDLGHYNEQGHAIIGRALFQALRQAGWLGAR